MFTHFGFLKTAVKTHRPLFAGSSVGHTQAAGLPLSGARPHPSLTPRPCPTLWFACASPASSAPPGCPVPAVSSSPRPNQAWATRGGLSARPRSAGHPAGAALSFRRPSPKTLSVYLLKFGPQTEMFSLRTIKATSNGLFLETEIPLQESDRVYRAAACGWRHCSWVSRAPRRP